MTDEIETFTEQGVRLRSGLELPADIIVAATGLKMRLMGGIAVDRRRRPVDIARHTTYKGMMYSDVPNLAMAIGYTNASWTLKADLIAGRVCRLLNHMDRRGYAVCTPRMGDASVSDDPIMPLTSGYVQRAKAILPKQGSRKPWRMNQNYALDMLALRFARDDKDLEFRPRAAPAA